MMKGIKLIPDGTHIPFIGMRYVAFVLSLAMVIGSFVLLNTKGLNYGIDFTGGTLVEIKTPVVPDLGEFRKDLNALGLGAISIQEFGEPDDFLIRMPQQVDDIEAEKAALATLREAIDGHFEEEVDYRRVEYVGPQVGKELKAQGMMAVLFSMLGILVYVWFRFEWQFGVASIIALAHDAIVTVGLFAFTGMEFNLSTVAAVLMIAGYSINDTVVVFDRIRETLRKYKKKPLEELFNMAINDMLARTLMTSLTTLLALIALYVFGGEVIRGFIYALIFGIFIGTYSSIFVAAPLLLFMRVKRSSFDEEPEDDAVEKPV